MTPERRQVLETIAQYLVEQRLGHPVRVGIDGICGAGKSVFARELVAILSAQGRPAVLVESDGFHHLRQRRHQHGSMSARGYYEDAYDFESLVQLVLRPLGPGGTRQYAVRVHDLATDEIVREFASVAPEAVVIFDATFIQRGELRDFWDEVIYLHAEEEIALARGVARDAPARGGVQPTRAAYDARYMAACRIYLAEHDPRASASVVIDNTDPDAPVIERLYASPRR